MATKTYTNSKWESVRVTTNSDWSKSVTVVNGNGNIASGTTYSSSGNGWITVSNKNSNQSQTFNNISDANNYAKSTYSNINNQNTNTTPTINLWDYAKFGADAYNTPNFDIDTRNNMIIQWLGANATNETAVRNYLMSNQSFANASATDQQNTINSILRKAATVATAQNPVVDVNTNQDSLIYDANDPQDFLDRLQARTALTWQQLTQEEYYNMLKAQRAIQQQQYQNPYEEYMKQLQQQLAEAQEREKQRDAQALQAYTDNLTTQYNSLISDQTKQWEASKTAAQNVYSFSGFGRSSAAANKQAEIQDTTNKAIQALNQQKLAEIELKRAELEWADGDELTYLKTQMDTLSQATTQWQLQALSQMAEANAQAGNDAVTSIMNMLSAASNSWIDITWDGYERIITAFNWMTPEQQDAYLSTLSDTDQLLVLWWAANSADGNYKFVSATKYQKAWYFNEKTGEFFPLNWWSSYSNGGGGGSSNGWNWSGEEWTWEAETIKNNTWEALNQLYNLSKAQRSKILLAGDSSTIAALDLLLWKWVVGTTKSNLNYITKNLTLNKFLDAKKNGATFGSMSNAEWDIISQSASRLNLSQTDADWKSTIQEIANNMWISLAGAKTYNSTNTTNNTNNTTNTTNTTTNATDRAAELLW